jgi:hypothetical protein
MSNELAVLIEDRMAVKGWSVVDLVRETGLDTGALASLLGPEELPDGTSLGKGPGRRGGLDQDLTKGGRTMPRWCDQPCRTASLAACVARLMPSSKTRRGSRQ